MIAPTPTNRARAAAYVDGTADGIGKSHKAAAIVTAQTAPTA
jgi:hypothetical protein